MKAAEDAGEEYYDPESEDNILVRDKTRLALSKDHLRDPIVALDKVLKCVESSCSKVLARVLREGAFSIGFLLSLWEEPIWEGVWPYLDPMDSVCLRTASMEWNVPRKDGPHGELFFFLIQKEPATLPGSETFSPCFNADIRNPLFSADVLKKCALVGLHEVAEEGRSGEDGCHAPDSGGRMESVLPRESNVGE